MTLSDLNVISPIMSTGYDVGAVNEHWIIKLLTYTEKLFSSKIAI